MQLFIVQLELFIEVSLELRTLLMFVYSVSHCQLQ